MSKIRRLLRYDWPLHFVLLLTNWMPDNVPLLKLRGRLAGRFLGRCGIGLELGRNVTFYNPSAVQIGDYVYIAYGCWFMAGEQITIGDEVLFGPYCAVVSSSHQRHFGSYRFAEPRREPIHIGRGSWIGGGVVVTAGSNIGEGVVIGANSVVRGAIPSNTMAAGMPAKVVKKVDDADA